MLRGPGLTPHKIRAERSSNLSFQKLRGAGLTPHFHDERSSNLSEFVPLPFLSSLSRPAVFLLHSHTTGSGPVRGSSPARHVPLLCLSLFLRLVSRSWCLYV